MQGLTWEKGEGQLTGNSALLLGVKGHFRALEVAFPVSSPPSKRADHNAVTLVGAGEG